MPRPDATALGGFPGGVGFPGGGPGDGSGFPGGGPGVAGLNPQDLSSEQEATLQAGARAPRGAGVPGLLIDALIKLLEGKS